MTDKPEQPKPSLEMRSRQEHKSRADKLHALSLAAAFGSLYYLIALEELLPPEESQYPWSLQTAWWLAYLSCLLGSVHLWLEMFVPFHANRMANQAKEDFLSQKYEIPEIYRRAERQAKRMTLWGIPLFGHVGCLLGVFLLSGFYRMANFSG